jgi:hypothetical protein
MRWVMDTLSGGYEPWRWMLLSGGILGVVSGVERRRFGRASPVQRRHSAQAATLGGIRAGSLKVTVRNGREAHRNTGGHQCC